MKRSCGFVEDERPSKAARAGSDGPVFHLFLALFPELRREVEHRMEIATKLAYACTSKEANKAMREVVFYSDVFRVGSAVLGHNLPFFEREAKRLGSFSSRQLSMIGRISSESFLPLALGVISEMVKDRQDPFKRATLIATGLIRTGNVAGLSALDKYTPRLFDGQKGREVVQKLAMEAVQVYTHSFSSSSSFLSRTCRF